MLVWAYSVDTAAVVVDLFASRSGSACINWDRHSLILNYLLVFTYFDLIRLDN